MTCATKRIWNLDRLHSCKLSISAIYRTKKTGAETRTGILLDRGSIDQTIKICAALSGRVDSPQRPERILVRTESDEKDLTFATVKRSRGSAARESSSGT